MCNGSKAIRLKKLLDEKILEKARHENRIILTVDLDFGTLLAIAFSKKKDLFIVFEHFDQNLNHYRKQNCGLSISLLKKQHLAMFQRLDK